MFFFEKLIEFSYCTDCVDLFVKKQIIDLSYKTKGNWYYTVNKGYNRFDLREFTKATKGQLFLIDKLDSVENIAIDQTGNALYSDQIIYSSDSIILSSYQPIHSTLNYS